MGRHAQDFEDELRAGVGVDGLVVEGGGEMGEVVAGEDGEPAGADVGREGGVGVGCEGEFSVL